MLKWATQNGAKMHSSTCARAALGGHLHVLKWARENGCPWDSLVCAFATARNDLEMLTWAKENGAPFDQEVNGIVDLPASNGQVCRAARTGNFNLIKWAHSRMWFLDLKARSALWRSGAEKFKVLQWINLMYSMPPNFGTFLIWKRDDRMMKWAKGHGATFDESSTINAARKGNWEALQWGRSHGAPLTSPEVCDWIAFHGNLEMIQWARRNGAPWGGNACKIAAKKGHLNVLQWAKEDGAPWTVSEVLVAAARGGNLSILQWVLLTANEDGLDVSKMNDVKEVSVEAMQREDVEMLEWAWKNKLPFNKKLCLLAARKRNLELLKWARGKGIPWGSPSFWRKLPHSEMLIWAKENGAP